MQVGSEIEGYCEACGQPLRSGHIVVVFEDCEVHADCENPHRRGGQTNAYVLKGKPLVPHPLPTPKDPHPCK